MKDFNFHVKPVGLLDMLRFKKLVPDREKKLSEGAADPVTAIYGANRLAAYLHPKAQRAKVADIAAHSENAKTYILSGERLAPFRAGQYLSVRLQIGGSVLTRPYSVSSSPAWVKEGKYALTVKRAADGFASGWILDNWTEGTEVTLSGPEGTFCYEPLRDAPHVIGVAGGSGITPFLAMAYAIRDGIEDFDLTVLYGSRTEEDILFKGEFEEIERACGRVKTVHVLSDEEKDGYLHGFITAELIRRFGGENPYSVFLCGPAAMYAFADREIEKLGLEPKFVRHELYSAPASPEGIPGYAGDAGKIYTLCVKCFGTVREIPMRASEPVLVALERAGMEAPSRCRGGDCGWCRSRLDKGEVFTPPYLDKRRAADIATGHIHPCCAYPLSDLTIEIWPE
jgi:ferredoxin-NADP reductase/ferredoxin